MSSRNPFEFIKAISETKEYLWDDFSEKEYVPFLTGRNFSYFHDTIMYANEVNYYIPPKMHHDYLFFSIKQRKRYQKWHKKENIDYIDIVMNHYGYNRTRAIEAISILTKEQLVELAKMYDYGKELNQSTKVE